jgi:hypothetical protein
MRVIERLAVSHTAICILAAVAFFTAAAVAQTGPTIVLIGGDKQGYPRTEHDYPDGILAIERLIAGSPQLQAVHSVVKSFPTGFPSDLSQIANADVVLLYFGLNYGTMGGVLDNEPSPPTVDGQGRRAHRSSPGVHSSQPDQPHSHGRLARRRPLWNG